MKFTVCKTKEKFMKQHMFIFLLRKTPWTQDVDWQYIRRSEDVKNVFWASYVRPIYILCPGGNFTQSKNMFSDWSK